MPTFAHDLESLYHQARLLQQVPGKGAVMAVQLLSRHVLLVLLVFVSVSTAGCEAIADIFQAGVWAGVLMVVFLIAIVGFIAARVRG